MLTNQAEHACRSQRRMPHRPSATSMRRANPDSRPFTSTGRANAGRDPCLIRPSEIKPLLPYVMIWSVEDARTERCSIRLVGDAIVQFTGKHVTGLTVDETMAPDAARLLKHVFADICATGVPRFRAGKAYWAQHQDYRNFEACFLPLSEDGVTVNRILCGFKFDKLH